jgi:predicted enzyme related to lactoylglutathione lyase
MGDDVLMNVDVLFACVPVTRLTEALPWYENLFGRSPDIVPNDEEVMWRVVDAGWLYILEDAARAGNAVVTLSFPDLDGVVQELSDRGLQPGPPEPVGDAGRKSNLTDPDGNLLSLIEVRSDNA